MLAAGQRLEAAGLATFDEVDTTCCYARQDKIWVHDPEVFVTHEDVDEPADDDDATRRACCLSS